MSDIKLRELQRLAYTGDLTAGQKLVILRTQLGQPPAIRGKVILSKDTDEEKASLYLISTKGRFSYGNFYIAMHFIRPSPNYPRTTCGWRWLKEDLVDAVIAYKSLTYANYHTDQIEVNLPDPWDKFDPWNKFIRNPDEDLRTLAKLAYQGDAEAGVKLVTARKRLDLPAAEPGEIALLDLSACLGYLSRPYFLVTQNAERAYIDNHLYLIGLGVKFSEGKCFSFGWRTTINNEHVYTILGRAKIPEDFITTEEIELID